MDISYKYKKTDGSTSGSILTLPKHSTAELYDGDHVTYFVISNFVDYSNLSISNVPSKILFKISNSSLNRLNYTKGNLVGYSRVKKEEFGNGHEIKEYSSPSSISDTYGVATIHASGSWENAVSNWIQFQIDYGFFPSISESNEVLRGNLLNHYIFNNEDKLLKHTNYIFDRKKIDSIRISENRNYSINCLIGLSGNIYRNIERNELVAINKYDYLQGNILENKEQYTYNPLNGLITEKSFLTSNQRTAKLTFTYPKENSTENFIQNLFTQNRISTPIKTINYIDNTKIKETKINYNEFNGKIEPSLVEVFYGESIEAVPVITFEAYDSKANPLQYKTTNNITTALLWGNNKTKLVSKVIGATYNELIATNIDLGIVNNPNSENELNIELNKIQNSFENNPLVHVETYIHKPHVGVAHITDTRNQTSSFQYDNFNRFSLSKDNNGNIITKSDYHLKKLQTYPISLSGFLDFKYIGNNQYKVTANATGGSGNYSYQWGANCYSNFETSTSSNIYILPSHQQPLPNINNFPCYDNQNRSVPVTCKIIDNIENIEIIRTVVMDRIIETPSPIFRVYLNKTGQKQVTVTTYDGSENYSHQWKENNGSYSPLSSNNTYSIQTILECEDEGGVPVVITCRTVDNITGEVLVGVIIIYETAGCQG
ncbi:MAG: hypothetical protein L3J09_07075 [Flavobacteriaceae bacterium]|nr:hypothetical protein [Flavobacteriaceae bacterium]